MEPKQKPSTFSSPWLWCLTTYFAEGLPYSIIRTVSPVYFRTIGVSLEGIGLSSLFGLPWILKFLWSPQIDGTSTKRRWLLAMQGFIAALFLASAWVTLFPTAPGWIGVLFFIGAFIAATHDTAIDGYYLAALDKDGQAKYIGYRIMAYRAAMMTGTGVIVHIGTHINWFWGFAAAGLILAILFIYHLFFLPECESPLLQTAATGRRWWQNRTLLSMSWITLAILLFFLLPAGWRQPVIGVFKGKNFPRFVSLFLFALLVMVALLRNFLSARLLRKRESFYARAFLTYMEQPRIGYLLAFIILVRAGEWSMANMVPPFIVDLGLKKQYGWISATVGLPASIAGALLGGWLISRWGMKKTIWPFLLLQNLTNILYMALASHMTPYLLANTGNPNPDPMRFPDMVAVALVNGFDQFAGGLGNAVLAIYLMRLCKSEFKAAHYAIGSGLMSLTGIFVGVASGMITQQIGYAWFFGLSFLFSIPGMILIFFIPRD